MFALAADHPGGFPVGYCRQCEHHGNTEQCHPGQPDHVSFGLRHAREYRTAFSLYNISNNTWVSRAVTPATVTTGGALAFAGNGNISAFRGTGGTGTTFWTYNISTNTWSTAAAVANAVAARRCPHLYRRTAISRHSTDQRGFCGTISPPTRGRSWQTS